MESQAVMTDAENLEAVGATKDTSVQEDEELVDISTVSVSKDLSPEERVAEYVRQIKNPYRFKCCGFTITARFDNDSGVTLEERLMSLFR